MKPIRFVELMGLPLSFGKRQKDLIELAGNLQIELIVIIIKIRTGHLRKIRQRNLETVFARRGKTRDQVSLQETWSLSTVFGVERV